MFHYYRNTDLIIDTNLPANRAITITGSRRCGKTYYFYYLIQKIMSEGIDEKRILYVNLEIPTSTKQENVYPFFDEIQNVANWEVFIRNILDKNRAKFFKQGHLQKCYPLNWRHHCEAEQLAIIYILFLFQSFLRLKGFKYTPYLSTNEKSQFMNLYRQYFNCGGYPEIVLYPDLRKKMIGEMINTTIYLDLIDRYKIRNTKSVKLMFNYLIKSKQFSTHKFYHFLKSLNIKVGKTSLYNYLEYFQDAFIIFPLKKFSYSLKKQEQSLPKIYSADNALIDAIVDIDDGKKLENMVFLSLIRKGYELNKELFYYSNGYECDFIIKNKKIDCMIQVCYDISDPLTKERELRSLLKAGEKLDCDNFIMVTYDYKADETLNHHFIKILPFYEFDFAQNIRIE
ncbi:MAG: ATPase [Candidatus Magnetoglobus multicellularis str. Araruama]|uniref:ATPase n=1 Tax=Candidatus Magnetoglobus multicellularis str. Araruama TaxID=890399 RepID=A0A1V1PC82_9BACT|nr:MAG: ATPase [Candidatus Magnetoglobus multicellularis str. Araruama]